MTPTLRRVALLPLTVLLSFCSSGEPNPVVPAGSTVERGNGNAQSVVVGTQAATPLTVVVKDANGVPLAGIPVTWTVSAGGGAMDPGTSTTDAAGTATAGYTAGITNGNKTIQASVTGATGSPISFSVSVLAGVAKRLVKSQGDGQSVGVGPFPVALGVVAVDTFGNGVSGVAVGWAIASGNGSVTPVSSTTSATGLASSTYTASSIGSATVTATSAGLAGSPVSFSETATASITLVKSLPIPDNYALHDQFIRGGLAFLCAWNTGLLIYDVGDGRAGGSPADPKLVGSLVTGGGEVHNAWWYWPPNNGAKRYVFVGQEGPGAIGGSSSGDIHVVDVSNMGAPQEVAFFHLANAGVHNFWVDEMNEVLYAAYYNGGVVALNISGTLTGDLAGRMIANTRPGGAGNTYIWGVQLYGGSLYATDMLSGFWQLNAANLTTKAGGGNVPERYGSDQWVANGYAYSGTWGRRAVQGNAVKIWQLNGTGAPLLVDSIITAGIGTVSDVEVSADNKMLMFSAEGGANNGVYFYSLVANPAHPAFIAFYPVGTGVHTATFAEINGHRYAFAAKDPGSSALLILDVTGISP